MEACEHPNMPQDSIEAVLAVILNRSSSGLMVAIDGRSAAGKSTLATGLTAHLPGSVVVRGDDFYRVMDDDIRFLLDPRQGYEQDFDWERLRQEVIEPLRRDERARFRRYDWSSGRLGELAIIEPAPVVLAEGVYMTRPELRDLFEAAGGPNRRLPRVDRSLAPGRGPLRRVPSARPLGRSRRVGHRLGGSAILGRSPTQQPRPTSALARLDDLELGKSRDQFAPSGAERSRL